MESSLFNPGRTHRGIIRSSKIQEKRRGKVTFTSEISVLLESHLSINIQPQPSPLHSRNGGELFTVTQLFQNK